MVFQYKHIENLPPLAWLAEIKGGIVKVIYGSMVEVKENWFVEGAWSGEFGQGDFLEADWFCGTGARNCGDKIVFSTPTHVTYGLYSVENLVEGGYSISNSLYLLMASENLRYDVDYVNYEVDFNTILDGINRYKNRLHVFDATGKEREVRIEYYKEIVISSQGKYESNNKKSTKTFTCFDDYYNRLIGSMRSMVDNAQNSLRSQMYGMVTTVSKGYDAPCCAAVAKKLGCNTALTFRPEGKYKDDCGTDVAKALGYEEVIEVDANEYLSRTDLVETEYICSGELGAQISFCSFDNYVRENILFTGERGDSIWGRFSHNRNNEFCFEDMLSHLGSCERRLWLNYISVPMPLYGASSWTSIYDISNSKEMTSWCVNNNYDRPIPRRIVEQAGVEREQFGVIKHGAGFVYKFDWMNRITSRMSKTTADSFKQFVEQYKKLHVIQSIRFLWKLRGTYMNRIGIRCKTLSVKEYAKIPNPMAARYLIPWAGEHMTKRYKAILER